MVRRDVGAQLLLDLGFEGIIQLHSLTQHHKEWQGVFPPWKLNAYNQTVEDLWERLDHTIKLTTAHANAPTIDSGVRPTIKDGAAPWRNLDPNALLPYNPVHVAVA